jgi:histidine triad (HIT) family protein
LKSNCIFCDIVAGRTEAEVIFENEDAMGILDINPIHYGHSLVIPKNHCRDFLELPPSSFSGVMRAVHTVAGAIVETLKLEGFNIFSNNGKIAGQSVFHFHFHITPRYENDNIKFVLKLKQYENGAMAAYAERIRSTIASRS